MYTKTHHTFYPSRGSGVIETELGGGARVARELGPRHCPLRNPGSAGSGGLCRPGARTPHSVKARSRQLQEAVETSLHRQVCGSVLCFSERGQGGVSALWAARCPHCSAKLHSVPVQSSSRWYSLDNFVSVYISPVLLLTVFFRPTCFF